MWVAPLILLAHTLITACVSPAVLLLSQHDHWVIGKVSAEQWVAHTQWHLKQLNGHYTLDPATAAASPTTTGTILAAKGCEMQAMQAFYSTLRSVPAPLQGWSDLIVVGHVPRADRVQRFTRELHVPLRPPRESGTAA